jgi:fermentation-respiration switch protein FrsA (DUF1100 family)
MFCCKLFFVPAVLGAHLWNNSSFVSVFRSEVRNSYGLRCANQALERLAVFMFNLQNVRFSHPSLKKLLFGSLGGSVGIVSILAGVGIYIVDTITRPKQLATFDFYTFSPFELNLPAEEITFSPLHGDHLVSGWYIPAENATSTIIICPGYRGRRSDVLGMCGQLWKAGHNVLAFEYYGHGEVVGKPITLGFRELDDFLGAIAYVKKRAPQDRLGALGYSMGAAVAIMGCARHPEVEALVADSPFATHRSAIEYAVRRTLHLPFALFDWVTDLFLWWRAGYHFNQVEPLRDIAKIAPRPILLIQGLKDTIVNPDDASLLYAAAHDPKEIWLVPDAEHCGAYFVDRIAYTRKVVDFFEVALKQSQQPLQLFEPGSLEQAHDDVDTHLSEAS